MFTPTVHPVPMEVAVALSTERTLFIDMLASRIKRGETIPPDSIIGMLGILKEMIEERRQLQQRTRELEDWVGAARATWKGLGKNLATIESVLTGAPVDEDGDEG